MSATSRPSVILGCNAGIARIRRFIVSRKQLHFKLILSLAGFLAMLTALFAPMPVHADDTLYTPSQSLELPIPLQIKAPRQGPEDLLVLWEVIPLAVVAGLALVVHLALRFRKRHNQTGTSESERQ